MSRLNRIKKHKKNDHEKQEVDATDQRLEAIKALQRKYFIMAIITIIEIAILTIEFSVWIKAVLQLLVISYIIYIFIKNRVRRD